MTDRLANLLIGSLLGLAFGAFFGHGLIVELLVAGLTFAWLVWMWVSGEEEDGDTFTVTVPERRR
jgi:hypothetical protein